MPEKLAESTEVEVDRPLRVKFVGQDILLVRSSTGLYAIRDGCPHIEQSLADGIVKDKVITCRHHGVQIDLKSGAIHYNMGFLDLQPVVTYQVWEQDGNIIIDTEDRK